MKFSRQHREGRPAIERPLLKSSTGRSRQWSPRRLGARRLISRYLIAVLLALIALVGISIARAQSWHTFFLPTNFASYDERWLSLLLDTLPDEPTRELRGSGAIGDRYIFKHSLGSGAEGSASVFHDKDRDSEVVIKKYGSQIRPMRNGMPDQVGAYFQHRVTHWSAELPASLLFGGLQTATAGNVTGDHPTSEFIPVYDYFLTSSDGKDWHWNFVTPLFASGTLVTLASKLQHKASSAPDIAKLDEQFRPAFDGLQTMLDQVHQKGFCHDDVKGRNVFVRDEANWILADLGAIREIEHPGHSTWTWRYRNQWQDCQQNDQRRLLKTYMAFLRQASAIGGSTSNFDERFFRGHEEWAALYWNFMAEEDATQIFENPQWRGKEPGPWAPARLLRGLEWTRRFAVDRELDGDVQDSWMIWRIRDIAFLGTWRMEQAWPAVA